ncbi:ABC transporter ATP-binding protein [Treponema sp.]|uniref:energy-coupling factor ABC transporter ATP-binding protein n=1 Tax=Treponema sp. TaxID=166 RepID=UPI00257CDEFE|nr:ABC transporter ATP-binding protein [Treponema sp.]MDY4210015.1 ABC transporter ATP-binding protein [Treponema sp.]
MLKINDICKSFETSEGINYALQNVSFEIPDGTCTVIGGENGSGKSVLMSIIAGLEEADSGTIENSCRAGLVFQEAETQILGETPREDIAFGPKNLGFTKEQTEQAVIDALQKTGLTSKADFPARFLSGGEKRRLAVACMIAMNLPVIILDEPYANLDFTGVKQVNSLVKSLKKQGRTVIILTHEIEKCLALAEKFIVLFRGKKVFDGTPEEIVKLDLEKWNIKNPFANYSAIKDLVW